MIETLAAHIPPSLHDVSGKVFYSGRTAFSKPADIYILGFNPGGDPGTHAEETVLSHTDFVLHHAPETWSGYCDESWEGRAPSEAPLQRRVRHLTAALGLDSRTIPSSNLVFSRSRRMAHLGLGMKDLASLCWPFHAAVIAMLRPKAVVCLGNETGENVRARLGARTNIGVFIEQNERRWSSHAYQSADGVKVFCLSHPAIADWTKPETDPSPMVKSLR